MDRCDECSATRSPNPPSPRSKLHPRFFASSSHPTRVAHDRRGKKILDIWCRCEKSGWRNAYSSARAPLYIEYFTTAAARGCFPIASTRGETRLAAQYSHALCVRVCVCKYLSLLSKKKEALNTRCGYTVSVDSIENGRIARTRLETRERRWTDVGIFIGRLFQTRFHSGLAAERRAPSQGRGSHRNSTE